MTTLAVFLFGFSAGSALVGVAAAFEIARVKAER